MQRRNIGLCVVFAIITCGIYMFYWMYQINETARRINPQRWNTAVSYTHLTLPTTPYV